MESLIISPPKKNIGNYECTLPCQHVPVRIHRISQKRFSFAWQGLLVSFPNFCVYYTASIFTNCGVSYIRHESLQGMFLISS